MKSDETDLNKAWSFVHDELDEESRKELKQMIAQDPELKREVEEVKQTNAYLRTLMPHLDKSDQELEEDLLRAWEATHEEQTPQQDKRDSTIPFPPQRKQQKEPLLLRPQTRITLAIAACVMIFVGVYHFSASPIKWMAPEIVPVKYRGEDIPGVYTPQELKDYSTQLRSAVNDKYEAFLSRSKKANERAQHAHPWTLRMRMQETNGGTLRVDVKAYKKDTTVPIQSWSEFYETRDLFDAEIGNFSTSISIYLAQFGQGE